MFWLTLLVVWAAASIVVAVVWGKLVRWGQESIDEEPDVAPASRLDASADVGATNGRRRSQR
jgi:hypothetical protein